MQKNTNKSYKGIFINIIISFVCLFSSVIVYFLQNRSGYELLFTQPIVYMLAFILVFSRIIVEDKSRLFFIILMSVSAIRYVILPVLIVVTQYYGGRSNAEPLQESFFKAILLMNYELIVVSSYIKYMEIKRINKLKGDSFSNYNLRLDKYSKDYGYLVFGIFTSVGLMLMPSVLLSINFIIPSSLSNSLELNFIQNIIVYCAIISKQIFFIIIVKKMYKLYTQQNKKIYILISLCMALFNTFIYFGTNRSDIIISAIVSFLLLYKLFGKVTLKYFLFGGVSVLFLIIMVSGAREHTSISAGNSPLIDLTDTFQVYTGGVYNVAIAIETKEYFPESNNLSVLFFDIFRPMIGINVLIKDLPFAYSNIYFNKRIWLNVDRRSQIIPMIGQGNLFFGFLLSPLFSIIFVRIFYYFEKIKNKTISIEIYYFLTLITVRFGFFMGQNTMNMINDMSMNLVLFILVFKFNHYIQKMIAGRA